MNLELENIRFIIIGAILLSLFIAGTFYRNKKDNPTFLKLGTFIYFLAMFNGVLLVSVDYYIDRLGTQVFRNVLIMLLLLDVNLLFYEAFKLNRKKQKITRGKNGKENL